MEPRSWQKGRITIMEPKSRTKKKQEALTLQKLGEQLVSLSARQMKEIHVPTEVLHAVNFAKKLKSHGARRRQLQYIGALMRNVDPEPIQNALQRLEQGYLKRSEAFEATEKWRKALMAGDDSKIDDFLSRFPAADRKRLTHIVREAGMKRVQGRPLRGSRTLFRYLARILSGSSDI